jgi:TraM recognition site of TraD and TraG
MNQKPLDRSDLFLLFIFVAAPISWWAYHRVIAAYLIGRHLFNHYYSPTILYVAALLSAFGIIVWACGRWNRFLEYLTKENLTAKSMIELGRDEDGEMLSVSNDARTRHTQVIGTTSAGKTESVILPWAIQDIQNGAGVIIIDGKADRSFLNKLYAYTVEAGRANDFRLFSLSNPSQSCSFNPLAHGTAQEVSERVFSSFKIENEYYESVQFRIFNEIISLILERGGIPTFAQIKLLLTSKEVLKEWIELCRSSELRANLTAFNELTPRDREEKVSGLVAKISHFCAEEINPLFNTFQPHLDLEQALRHNQICYFQLPTMYYRFLGAATGKLVLQCLQSAVAKRHNDCDSAASFVSVFLDDFQDYIYEGFEALLNKSRSANIGMVFSHQALGDLDKVSPAFRNVVTTNTNIKIVMRNNDPDTAEHFASSFGTRTSSKETERVSKSWIGSQRTGELSVRAVEEYLFHPNVIKTGLATGEAIVSIPEFQGVVVKKLRFKPKANKGSRRLPTVPKGILAHEDLMQPPGAPAKKEEGRVA